MLYLPDLSPLVKGELRKFERNVKRAEKAGLPSDLTFNQWIAICCQHEWQCAFCGGDHESMEHVVPISMGGGTTVGNVLPCCERCNAERHWFVQLVVERVRPVIFDEFLIKLVANRHQLIGA